MQGEAYERKVSRVKLPSPAFHQLKENRKQHPYKDTANDAYGKNDDISCRDAAATAACGVAIYNSLCFQHNLLLPAFLRPAAQQKIRLVKDLRVGSFE